MLSPTIVLIDYPLGFLILKACLGSSIRVKSTVQTCSQVGRDLVPASVFHYLRKVKVRSAIYKA